MFNMSKYSDWQKGIANRNYHILHNLVKHDEINKVIAVDFLPFNLKRALKTFFYNQVINDTQGTIIYGDLTSRCWQITSKILVYSTIDSILNPDRIISELIKIIAKEDMQQNLIVWNYNPMYVDYFEKLDQDLNVFDAVDDWLSHSSYKNYKPKLDANYNTIRAKSDLIFTVSEYLKENFFQNQHNVFWLPNAVDLEFFQAENKVHPLVAKLQRPIIGFLGILQDRVDIEIIKYLAQNNPEKNIVLAGPIWPNFPQAELTQYKNIHFLGPIKHWQIPSLYKGFDVGIIPYKTNKFIKSTDPMKYYEYLAANLPIVSTYVPGIERFDDLIYVARSPEQFSSLVGDALAGDRNLLRNERLAILRNNTWDHRVKEMLELIYSKLKLGG